MCAINAKIHAKSGFGVLLANTPAPMAGMKKNHGTITLIIPKTSPSLIERLTKPSWNKKKNNKA